MVDDPERRSLEPTLPADGPTLDDVEATGASVRPSWSDVELPARIGRFSVVRRLGTGGMGVRHAEAEAERSVDALAMAEVLAARGSVLMQSGEPALPAWARSTRRTGSASGSTRSIA